MYWWEKICKYVGFNFNYYTKWDNSINPKWLIFHKYGETTNVLDLEGRFSKDVIQFLEQNGSMIEKYTKVSLGDNDNGSNSDNSVPAYAIGDSDFSYPDSFLVADSHSSKYWYKDNIVELSAGDSGDGVSIVVYAPKSKPLVGKEFEKFYISTEGKSHVSILISRNGNLVVNSVDFEAPEIADLELNYGKGFSKVHDKIVNRLNEKRAGLIIFHGVPGSGKSTYIKHLSSIIDREFIFVPVNLTSELASPSFISSLLNHKDAIIILEDAEQAVRERGNGYDDSIVSTLLNMSDGILGNILRITLIVSWNMDRQHVDKALLRKGRLLFEHDFGELDAQDAQRLANHIGKNIEVKHPMTLADIYGVETGESYVPKPPKEMGFHTLPSITPKENNLEKKDSKEEKT